MVEVKTKVCIKCGEEKLKTTDFFYWRNDTKKFRNVCIKCVKDYQKQSRIKNFKHRKEYDKNLNDNLKLEVISYYGGRCAVCGEATLAFLTIDHINNDGAEERREDGFCGNRFYRKLKKEDFPIGFQVLCFNHNFQKQLELNKLSWLNTEKAVKLREWHCNLKLEVISHYGGICQCCGESDIRVLTIDHIEGGGKKHRKEVGVGNFYSSLIKNNFPPGFQVLCFNCNSGRSVNHGICPHKERHD
jgi:hypothetical protein